MAAYPRREEQGSYDSRTGARVWSRRYDEKRVYKEDVTELLGSSSISSVDNKESSGITIDALTFSAAELQCTVSKGWGYVIVKVTRADGEIFERPFKFEKTGDIDNRDTWSY